MLSTDLNERAVIGGNGGPAIDVFDKSDAAREFWGFIERIRKSDLPAPGRHVAIEIWLHFRLGKMHANPSVARLAEHTGLSERTVRSMIKLLPGSGLFDVKPSDGGRHKTNTYIAMKIDVTVQELHRLTGQNPAGAAPLKKENPAGAAPFKAETLQNLHENPAGAAPEAFLEATKKTKPLGRAYSRRELDDLQHKLLDACNGAADPTAVTMMVMSEPIKWIESGCDLEMDILPVIKARSHKLRPQSLRNWSYFTQAVSDARTSRNAPMPEGNAPPTSSNRRSPRLKTKDDMTLDELRAYYERGGV